MSMKSGHHGKRGKRYLQSVPDMKLVRMRCPECGTGNSWLVKTPKPEKCIGCGKLFRPFDVMSTKVEP
jgi:uncharacterized OB-fold protein